MSTTVNAPASTTQVPLQMQTGNLQLDMLLQLTISPASVAAATVAEQSFTLTGLIVGDQVTVSKPTFQAGLAVVSARVTAANTIAIAFINPTASPIVPTASEVYTVALSRPIAASLSAGLPTSLPTP